LNENLSSSNEVADREPESWCDHFDGRNKTERMEHV
jgi:hypothetical protein